MHKPFGEFCQVEGGFAWERGQLVNVAKFEVSVEPVRVGSMMAFQDATGYVTQAERHKSDNTYCSGPEVRRVCRESRKAIDEISAMFLSYDDAMAFCEWTHCRLLTNREWLAASVVDWTTVYDNGIEAAQKGGRLARIKYVGYEWISDALDTVEVDPDFSGLMESMVNRHTDVLLRYGPICGLFTGWNEPPMVLRCPRELYHRSVRLRVAKSG